MSYGRDSRGLQDVDRREPGRRQSSDRPLREHDSRQRESRRDLPSPFQHSSGRAANSSPAESISRREGSTSRRASDASAPHSNLDGTKDPVFLAVDQLYSVYTLLAERVTLQLRKQELAKQEATLTYEGKALMENRFDEYPSARELHAKRSERIAHESKKTHAEIDTNKNDLGKCARGFVELIGKLSGANEATTDDSLETKVSRRLAALEKKIEEQQSTIRDQSLTVDALSSQHQTLRGHFDALEAENSRLKSALSNNAAAKISVDSQLSDLKSEMQSIRLDMRKGDVEKNEVVGQVKQDDLLGLKSRIDRLEVKDNDAQGVSAKLASLEASINQGNSREDGLSKTTSAKVEQLRTQMITSLGEFADQFSDMVDNLESRVTALEATRTGTSRTAGEGLHPGTDGNLQSVDGSDRDAILDTVRRQHSENGTPVPAAASAQGTINGMAASLDVLELKEQLLKLRISVQELETGHNSLKRSNSELHKITSQQREQLIAIEHGVAVLSQQFSNITTEEMCKRIVDTVFSMRSMEDQGRRIDELEVRTRMLEETARSQPLMSGADAASKKRKMSFQADPMHGNGNGNGHGHGH